MKRAQVQAALAGIAAAAALGVASFMMPSRYARDVYAMLLVFSAAVDVGAALSHAKSETLLVSFMVASLFFFFALLGRWVRLEFLVIGYLAHALMDTLRGLRIVRPPVTAWWPLCCGCFDVTLAGLLYARWIHA